MDWLRGIINKDQVIISRSSFSGDHKDHFILYPGFKGKPKEEPFIKFHEHLKKVAEKTMMAIFVGFSFRDQYINDILSENLPTEVPKYVITKGHSLPLPPFLESFGFGA